MSNEKDNWKEDLIVTPKTYQFVQKRLEQKKQKEANKPLNKLKGMFQKKEDKINPMLKKEQVKDNTLEMLKQMFSKEEQE